MKYCGPAHWAYNVTKKIKINDHKQLFGKLFFSNVDISMYEFCCTSMVFIKYNFNNRRHYSKNYIKEKALLIFINRLLENRQFLIII